ncbi:SDR family NAD(P)-dependent oxidoreductase [Nocardia sp. CA-129566]|uniref:SDR family NAD(P)-dependent oxidoreductase n=1 Tax=Nocardia sp. CA-129566 TaxID=3239976 RepID=UPI003D97A998
MWTRREQLGEGVAESIGGAAHYVRTDIRVPAEVERLVDRRFGRLDVASNNAGIRIEGAAEDLSVEQWDDVLDTNLRGIFLSVKYEVLLLERSGGGVILCAASKSLMASAPADSARKAGIEGLVDGAAVGPAWHPGRCDRPGHHEYLADPPGRAAGSDVGGLQGHVGSAERIRAGSDGRARRDRPHDPRAVWRRSRLYGSTVLVGGGPFGGDAARVPGPLILRCTRRVQRAFGPGVSCGL